MIPVCPTCEHVHCSRDVTAVGRFKHGGIDGFRHGLSRQLFATRTDAEADLCRTRTEGAA